MPSIYSGGLGSTSVIGYTSENNTYGLRLLQWIVMASKYNEPFDLSIYQLPNPETTIKVSGDLKVNDSNISIRGYIVDEDTYVNGIIKDDKYILYTKKGSPLRLKLVSNGSVINEFNLPASYSNLERDIVLQN